MATMLLAPPAGAAGIALFRTKPRVCEAASLVAAAALFALVATLLPAVMNGARPELEVFEILPGIAFTFQAEPLGVAFALVVAFLWLVTVVYAIGNMRAHGETHLARFYFFFTLAITATIGGAFAGNLLTLYFFYEALTLSTYPLVTHGRE